MTVDRRMRVCTKLPNSYRSCSSGVDSGQFLVDTRRHGDALEWLWLLNSHPSLIEHALQGDKDTFRVAFAAAAHSDFVLVNIPVRAAGNFVPAVVVADHHPVPGLAGYKVRGFSFFLTSPLGYSYNNPTPCQGPGFRLVAMVQSHPQNSAPLFVHRTQSKLTLAYGYAKLQNVSSPLSRTFLVGEFTGEDSVPAFSFRHNAFENGRLDSDVMGRRSTSDSTIAVSEPQATGQPLAPQCSWSASPTVDGGLKPQSEFNVAQLAPQVTSVWAYPGKQPTTSKRKKQ